LIVKIDENDFEMIQRCANLLNLFLYNILKSSICQYYFKEYFNQCILICENISDIIKMKGDE